MLSLHQLFVYVKLNVRICGKGKYQSMNNTKIEKEKGNSYKKKMKRSPDERHT